MISGKQSVSREDRDALDRIELPGQGTVRRGKLRFSHPTLEGVSWPYTAVRGASEGPHLALISGVHPTEYPAIEANIRVMRSINPDELRGSIVSLPIIDVPAFLSRSPFVCPVDGKNPNRFFPGDPAGTFTEVLDDAIFKAVIEPADFFLDLHGGDMVEALVPFSIYSTAGSDDVNAASAEMGRVFGLPYLIASTPQPGGIGGTTVEAAAAAGVPGIIAEAGSSGLLTEPETQMLIDGVQSVLRHLKMVDGDARVSTPVEVSEFTWLNSPAEGMWYPSVSVGETVSAGQSIGRIGDLFGETLEEITSPHDGDVLFITSSPAMRKDGLIIAIGA